MGSPFAFKIDYAASIAQDEALIALYSSPVAIAIAAEYCAEDEVRALAHGGGLCDGPWFLFGDPARLRARMAAAGLSVEDVATYAHRGDGFATGDAEIDARVAALRGLTGRPAWDAEKAGDEMWVRISELPVGPEERRVRLLRKAKASLARHKRNAAKYGGK